jgi:glycosyltransferase involved in cell wall biosynthesis
VTVGVVIPCRNEARWLAEVLNALALQDRRPDEVTVVDDGSVDGTTAVVEEWRRRHPDLQVRIVAGPSRGVAAAVNAGVEATTTDVVVRLDGHCRPAADYIARAVALITLPGVGVVGGVWIIEPGAASLEAEAIAIAAAHLLGSGDASYRRTRIFERAEVDTVPFGCFKRSLWQELGGFDERLESNEDYDFNYRVRQRGLRIVLDPQIRCTYYARPTMRALARQYSRYGWWKARMLLRRPRAIRWRQVLPALLVPALLVVCAGMVFGGGYGWWWTLAVYPVATVIGAAHAAATRGRWAATAWLAGIFMTIHLTWGVAFWMSLAFAGLSRRQVGA